VFSPVCFRVELVPPHSAVVVHEADRIPVHYEENDSAIHAVAGVADRSADRVLGWCRLDASEAGDAQAPSRAVRSLLCERVAERLGVAVSALEVRSQGRVPFLWLSGRPAKADLSLSHHGDWLGFACELGAVSS